MSGSGVLASLIRENLLQRSIPGEAFAVRNADYVIKRMDRITLSSDSVIIGKVGRAVDAGRAILKRGEVF